MADDLLEAVRGLHLADPELGVEPLLAKLRQQQPELDVDSKQLRNALEALKAESEVSEAAAAPPAADETEAAAAPPAADETEAAAAPFAAEVGGAPVVLSLACFGCGRQPWEMGDGRKKHDVCRKCVKDKLPTTYWCGVNCPACPGAWKGHMAYHKKLKVRLKRQEDGGAVQQQNREAAERQTRMAEQTGDEYTELLAEATRYGSQEDTRKAARAYREAITLRPDRPDAYYGLGAALSDSGHYVEAAQRYFEAKERYPEGSKNWAVATAHAFTMLTQDVCAEVAKPEGWNDEGLKALSARVVRAAPNCDMNINEMRALVLAGQSRAWEAGSRSAAELNEAATYFDRAAALCPAPAVQADLTWRADQYRSLAAAL